MVGILPKQEKFGHLVQIQMDQMFALMLQKEFNILMKLKILLLLHYNGYQKKVF